MASLFDMFTGKPQKQAAQQTRTYLDQSKNESLGYIDQGLGTSLANIGQGYGSGRDALTGGYNTSVNTLGAGFDAAGNALAGGVGNARGYYDAARGDLSQAGGAMAGLGAKYGAGSSLYLDSLGINGAEGNARATASFQPTQAYNFNLDQGLEAINRRRNAGGMLNSGNADRDAQEYGAGLASKEYGGWQDRLAGLINPELAATTGAAGFGRDMANVNIGQAGFENNAGQTRAAMEQSRGAMLADLAKSYGGAMAGNYQSEGTALAGLNSGAAGQRVGLNNAMINPYTGTYQKEADASMQGSKNMWGLGMSLASLAAGVPGLGSGLQGLFGAGASQSNPGVTGGGYLGTGGQVYPGPGYYGR